MESDFLERVAKVDWHSLDTAYGTGGKVGRWLVDLRSSDSETAFQASHRLWCSLCHQHAYVSPAAAPALTFLFEVADTADDKMLVELLDIFSGFASCSRPPASAWPIGGAWVGELRQRLLERREWFEKLARSPNEGVGSFAEQVVESLAPVDPTKQHQAEPRG